MAKELLEGIYIGQANACTQVGFGVAQQAHLLGCPLVLAFKADEHGHDKAGNGKLFFAVFAIDQLAKAAGIIGCYTMHAVAVAGVQPRKRGHLLENGCKSLRLRTHR